MPPERQPAQKRRQLPFKPPSRQSSATAGPSTSASASTSASTSKPNSKPKPKSTSKVSAKATTIAKASSSKTARPSITSTRDEVEASESPAAASNSDSEASSGSSRSRSPSEEPDYILAEIIHAEADENDVLSSEPAIPPKLLTKLVHHHFKGQKTKIAKDANEVVAKYVDVFVREALARAAFERAEGAKGVERGVGDGFLEVEDLEKMAPQLVLDF